MRGVKFVLYWSQTLINLTFKEERGTTLSIYFPFCLLLILLISIGNLFLMQIIRLEVVLA